MIPQVAEIISAIETDEQVKAVVFDSAVEGFVLIHLDFLAFKRPRTPTGNWPRRAPERRYCRLEVIKGCGAESQLRT
jgi:hypothetical protein